MKFMSKITLECKLTKVILLLNLYSVINLILSLTQLVFDTMHSSLSFDNTYHHLQLSHCFYKITTTIVTFIL